MPVSSKKIIIFLISNGYDFLRRNWRLIKFITPLVVTHSMAELWFKRRVVPSLREKNATKTTC